MKILIFYIITSSSNLIYSVSDRYILYQILPKSESNDSTPMKTQLLDMETGLLHEINADNSKRQVQPYTDRGHWDVYREILDTTIISDQQYLGFNCEIIETTSKPLLPLAGGDSEYKSVFTFCDIPQLYNFIKKEKYLSFLHFYHSDTHKKPFYFKLNSQFLADNFCTTIEQVVSIEEKESEPDFFTSLLSIPE